MAQNTTSYDIDIDISSQFDTTDHDKPLDEKSEGQSHAQLEELEYVSTRTNPDGEDFAWDYDVITNLLAVYCTYFSTNWAQFLLPFGLTFVEEAFPDHPDITPWVASVPSVCTAVISLFIGELSDIFGRRFFMLLANTFVVVGMCVASRASNVTVLVGGQVLNGLGAGLGLLSLPALSEIVPKRSRSWVVAAGGVFLAVLTSAGGISEGVFVTDNTGGYKQGWRMGVYLGIGFAVIGLALTIIFYHPGPRPNPGNLSVRTRLGKIDWFGLFIGTLGLTLALVGLQGGGTFAWDSPRVLVLIIVGFFLVGIFVIWEWKFVEFGLFPRVIFRDRNYRVIVILQFVEGMSLLSGQAFLPQMITTIFDKTAVVTTVRNFPFAAGLMGGSAFAAVILYKTREVKILAISSVVMIAAGAGMFAALTPDINFAVCFFGWTLYGFGVAQMTVIVPVVASITTPDEFIATAVSLCNAVRDLGGAIGIVMFSQILQSKITKKLPVDVGTAAFEAGIPLQDLATSIEAFLSGDAAAIEAAGLTPTALSLMTKASQNAYAQSWRWVRITLLPFCAVTFLLAFFLRTTKKNFTMEVAAAVQHRHAHHNEKEKKVVQEEA